MVQHHPQVPGGLKHLKLGKVGRAAKGAWAARSCENGSQNMRPLGAKQPSGGCLTAATRVRPRRRSRGWSSQQKGTLPGSGPSSEPARRPRTHQPREGWSRDPVTHVGHEGSSRNPEGAQATYPGDCTLQKGNAQALQGLLGTGPEPTLPQRPKGPACLTATLVRVGASRVRRESPGESPGAVPWVNTTTQVQHSTPLPPEWMTGVDRLTIRVRPH